MRHAEREVFVGWVFDSATYTLGRGLDFVLGLDDLTVKEAKEKRDADPTFGKLRAFRDEFDGRRFADEVPYATRWTPDHCISVFTPLTDVLRALEKTFPEGGEAATTLQAKLAGIGASSASDGCAALDDLLTSFLAPALRTVSMQYWAAYRKLTKERAVSAGQDALTPEARLTGEIEAFYRDARAIAKDNDLVLGSLVEEFLRLKIAGLVFPFQVSSGGIYGLKTVSQIDAIIWDRKGFPPAIEVGQIAVVAPQSVVGLIEIKASYDSKLATFVERMQRLSAEGAALQTLFGKSSSHCLGVLIWTDFGLERAEALGGDVVVPLFQRLDDGSLQPNPRGLHKMLHFLQHTLLGVV